MARTYGFLSTYPPTQCGLATFSSALRRHLTTPWSTGSNDVVRVVHAPSPSDRPEVVHQLVNGTPGGANAAAAALNRSDVAIVQHEYGIYGGPDGEDVIEVLAGLRVPAIVVLHTVLGSPTRNQRRVLNEVIAHADAVVTMSDTAAHRLLDGYTVPEPASLVVIPHGAVTAKHTGGPSGQAGGRPMILTWGLLGRGKGIEWAISAIAGLRGLTPLPRYLVAGQTHPQVLLHEGEAYRSSLIAQAGVAGVADLVEFDSVYRDDAALAELVRQADVVLLPYDSPEQVTSGVLIEAVAARRPVVATRFPHAVELLSGGAGLLVPHRDPKAITAALLRVLTEPGLAAGMATKASSLAPSLRWPAVAARYRELADSLVASRTDLPV
jgi:glycosyltransferase involved in cell wall biosynthesis